MIESLVQPHLRGLKPYESARHLHPDMKGILLDANENAFGSVVKAPYGLTLNRYPDPFSKELKHALSHYVGLSEEHIFVGVGSDEVIDLLIRLFVGPREEVILFEPTYGMYRVASEIAGAKIQSCPLNDEFQLDLRSFKKLVSSKAKMAFCCSPNNPTGNSLEENSVVKLCKSFGGMVIVDEAYVEFASAPSLARLIPKLKNLAVLRTFSKAWGLAGLRVGYALAQPEVVAYLNKIKPPYNLNALSAYLAKQALQQKKQMARWRNQILKEREKLSRTLEELGCEVFPSDANFILIRIPEAARVAKALASNYHIIVRDFSNRRHLGDCLRLAVGTPEQNKLLVKAMGKLV